MDNVDHEQNERVVRHLKTCFDKKLEEEIIDEVAYESSYNIEVATNRLLEIIKDMEPVNHVRTNEKSQLDVYFERIASNAGLRPEVNVQRLINDIKSGMKVLVILRGLPGSGKSYLADRIVRESINTSQPQQYILSADDYFYKNGVYQYDYRFIKEAHEFTQKRANKLMLEGWSPVVIDNTNTQMWEMKPYCVWAVASHYSIEVVEAFTPWAFKVNELTKKNKHGVPKDKIRDMCDRYEKNINSRKLFLAFNLFYSNKLPPQVRTYPALLATPAPKVVPPDKSTMKVDLNSWGITGASSSTSWDTTFGKNNEMSEEDRLDVAGAVDVVEIIEFESVGTNTDSRDFNVGKKLKPNSTFITGGPLIVKYSRGGRYDKGTMTEVENEGELEDKFKNLMTLFPNIPAEYLQDVLEKCRGDMEWCIDLLIEDKMDIIENYERPVSQRASPQLKPEESVSNVDITKCSTSALQANKTTNCDTTNHDTPKRCKYKNSEENEELKQHIEASVVINREHYSNHILKLKKLSTIDLEPQAGTSSMDEILVDEQATTSKCSESLNEIFEIDSDSESLNSDESNWENATMEINLGEFFVTELEKHFDGMNIQKPQGFKPVIDIPISLGAQLYSLYLDSVCKQMEIQKETMIKEDEDFAMQLQLEEEKKVMTVHTPNFKQIMTEQAEASRQQEINEQWRNQTPNNIAYKLTKQKLSTSFPSIDTDILEEILFAHDNSYKATLDSLLSSGLEAIDTVLLCEPPISEIVLADMQLAYDNTDNSDTVAAQSVDYRKEAQRAQQKRQELLNKAREYARRGMTEVAWFYSDLATQQTNKWEKFNNLAAEQILNNNFSKINNFDTLDLHFLHVNEAINSLDIFLDRNIRLLRKERKADHNYLHVITGRGKNSWRGIAKIKPAVKQRLQARGLKFESENAGLFRVKIHTNSVMTDQLS